MIVSGDAGAESGLPERPAREAEPGDETTLGAAGISPNDAVERGASATVGTGCGTV